LVNLTVTVFAEDTHADNVNPVFVDRTASAKCEVVAPVQVTVVVVLAPAAIEGAS